MEPLKNFTIVLICFITGCNDSSTIKVRSFIPGTYVSHWTDEFANTNDTLVIEKMTQNGSSTFKITRHMVSQLNHTNKLEKLKYRISHWTGNYDPNQQTMLINNNGRIFSFDPDRNELKSGNITYQKIKK